MPDPSPNEQDALYKHWRWRIFFITWLAYAGFYLTRKSFAVAKVDLARPEVLGLGIGDMSWLDFGYAAAYAVGQFVWGMCGDRYGTRRVILYGMIASVLTAIFMGASSLVIMLGILFCFQGVCQSTGWAPLTKNIGNFFAQKERGRMMGFWCTNYALGGVIASALAGFAIEWGGQNRLAEYQPDQLPVLAEVVKVAASQGRDRASAEVIHGQLLIAHATTLPPTGAADKLAGLFADSQQNVHARSAALRGLHTLNEPRFDEALKAALQSRDTALKRAAEDLQKQIEKERKREANGDSPKPLPVEKQLKKINQQALHILWGMLGWRFAFWVPAAVLFGIWVLFIWLQRNRPQDVGLPAIEDYKGEDRAVLTGGTQKEEAEEGSWPLIWQVMSNRMVQLLAAVYLLLKPARYLILFWSPLYVNEKLGTGAAESGIIGSLFELAGPLGVLLGGYMSDKVFGSRRMPMAVIGLVVVAVVLLGFNALPETKWALGSAFFFIGFFLYMPDSLVAGAAALDFGTRKGAGTAAGMINGFGSIGAIVGVTLPGILSATLSEGADIWSYIFPGLGVSLVLAAVLLLPKWNALPATEKTK
jgi:sugar phosphate permease